MNEQLLGATRYILGRFPNLPTYGTLFFITTRFLDYLTTVIGLQNPTMREGNLFIAQIGFSTIIVISIIYSIVLCIFTVYLRKQTVVGVKSFSFLFTIFFSAEFSVIPVLNILLILIKLS